MSAVCPGPTFRAPFHSDMIRFLPPRMPAASAARAQTRALAGVEPRACAFGHASLPAAR